MPRKKPTEQKTLSTLVYTLESLLSSAQETLTQITAHPEFEDETADTPMGKATKPKRGKSKVKDVYTEEELAVMSRVKLTDVAGHFGIDTAGLLPPAIRTAILDVIEFESTPPTPNPNARRGKKKAASSKRKKKGGLRIKV